MNDWSEAFAKLKALPQGINSVRVYASSDCDTLKNAVPAALYANIGILVGVWVTDDAHYQREKDALQQAITNFGHSWITAISVGSEDLYRTQVQNKNEIDPNTLAARIQEVRTMVSGMNIQVGHVDTWDRWTDPQNNVVITACDFVGMDAYPYFQSVAIEGARDSFFSSLQQTRDAVSRAGSNAWVWVTETGHPVSGANFGPSVPSVQNAQTYWNEVACALFQQAHVFWYSYQDYNASPSFGVFDGNGNAQYAQNVSISPSRTYLKLALTYSHSRAKRIHLFRNLQNTIHVHFVTHPVQNFVSVLVTKV
jgi:glucan endo-1,3-beta-D-glucosidase